MLTSYVQASPYGKSLIGTDPSSPTSYMLMIELGPQAERLKGQMCNEYTGSAYDQLQIQSGEPLAIPSQVEAASGVSFGQQT